MSNKELETVLRIYDTVADQGLWTDVLDEISEMIGARGSLIFEIDKGSLHTPHFSSMYDGEALKKYNRDFRDLEMADHAKFHQHSFLGDKIEIISDEVLYSDIEEFKKRDNVKYVMDAGILHRAAALLNKDNPNISRFSVQYKSNRGPITGAEKARMNTFLPHVAKALDLGRPAGLLEAKYSSLLALLDKMTIGVCILDSKYRVILQNEEFRRQKDTHQVFRVDRNQKLMLEKPDDQRRFESLLNHPFNHGQFGARPPKEAVSAQDDSYLCIEVSPLDNAAEFGTEKLGGFILQSIDTSLPFHYAAEPIREVYRLTETEMSMMTTIAEGLTNAQIANQRNRSIATINAQVKSILSKTHCSNRTQLVRMLMSFGVSPAPSNLDERSSWPFR